MKMKSKKISRGRYSVTNDGREYTVTNLFSETQSKIYDNVWLVERGDHHIAPENYKTKKQALKAIESGEADLSQKEYEIKKHISRLKQSVIAGDDLQPFWDSATINGDEWLMEALSRM